MGVGGGSPGGGGGCGGEGGGGVEVECARATDWRDAGRRRLTSDGD